MDKRKDKRFAKRLHVKLSSGSSISWGLLCDVSENGLFIRSNQSYKIDALIDIHVFMPDNSIILLKGVLRRITELAEQHRKFGIGVELIEKNTAYENFLKFLDGQTKKLAQSQSSICDNEVRVTDSLINTKE